MKRKVQVLVIMYPGGDCVSPEDENYEDGSGMQWDAARVADYLSDCVTGTVGYVLEAELEVPLPPQPVVVPTTVVSAI